MGLKYKVNSNFFKNWNIPMAWTLGVLMGDGNIHGNSLTLEMNDRDVVEKVKFAFNAEHRLYTTNRKNRKTTYVLTFNDRQIIKDASKLGLIPRKSKIMKLPFIPYKYFSHFLRGFLDSNGSIFMQGRNNSQKITTALYTASGVFAEQLVEKITSFGYKAQLYSRSHTTFEGKGWPGVSWRVVSGDVKLLPWIYKNKDIYFMERKYSKYQELLKQL